MPNQHWEAEDEKQYRHVYDSEIERGQDKKTAERIAAATVNKERRREGRTMEEAGTARQDGGTADGDGPESPGKPKAAKGAGPSPSRDSRRSRSGH